MKFIGTTAKFGSELVTNADGVDHGAIQSHAQELIDEYAPGGLVVVTSGAVAAGRLRVEGWGDDVSKYELKTLAQLGSASIMKAWEDAFDNLGIKAGGLLTTHHEIDDRHEGPSLIQSMRWAAERDVVSIVNENDALSVVELMRLFTGGENDGLAAHLAIALGCARLRLFTRGGGIRDEDGRVLGEINKSNYYSTFRMIYRRSGGISAKKAGNGRGGAHTKLKWAARSSCSGVETQILRPLNQGSDQRITKVVVG